MTATTPVAVCGVRALHVLAKAAGALALRHFQTKLVIEVKADRSPVTIADRECERLIRERIAAAYPKDVKKRAKVNEMMDWFNSNLYRDWGYGLVYPQVFPGHKRPDDKVQSATLGWHTSKN